MAKLYWKPGNMLYPLPVVMVSCRHNNQNNIITVAWAGTINSDPPMLSISVRKERYSYHMIDESKEFVVNLTTKDLAFATDYCGVASGRDVDKFKEMNLTPVDSKYVGCPSILESPVNLECKVVNQVELGTHTIFMANILGVTVDDKYMDETGRFNLNDADLITYSHGRYYTLGEKIDKFGHSVRKK
jgi:flavin reductase (DIM6/NTAB) family NADH-FMN oxidoreductase RutF